jgi:spore germination cell wall hydrolase CwlJ-like protein
MGPMLRLRLLWYRTDMEPWVFALILGAIAGLFVVTFMGVFSFQKERQTRSLEKHAVNVHCLARNVYYEARGEPLAGQYAVAEVTMNRKASRRFPGSVCEVVYQQNWDPIRKRNVGAFSWTEFNELPEPAGAEWERALKVADAVYYEKEPPKVKGALFYHANYIKPDWAREKRQVAKIGRHIFYR